MADPNMDVTFDVETNGETACITATPTKSRPMYFHVAAEDLHNPARMDRHRAHLKAACLQENDGIGILEPGRLVRAFNAVYRVATLRTEANGTLVMTANKKPDAHG